VLSGNTHPRIEGLVALEFKHDRAELDGLRPRSEDEKNFPHSRNFQAT
jgi:hypothetical protein